MESVPSTEQPLWRPPPEQISQSNLTRFCEWLRERRFLDFKDHRSLYDWSVGDMEGFWSAIAEFFAVRFHTPAERVLQRAADPILAKWFPGATLNYTEHLLRFGSSEIGQFDQRPATIFCMEPGVPDNRRILTRAELVARVGELASALSRLGVVRGDRVAGYLPNRFETLIAFLATASLGAIWSNCPPELSSRGAVDRLAQIEPTVLLAVSGYRYGGKSYDRAAALTEITANLPTLRHLIIVEQAPGERLPDCRPGISAWRWFDLLVQQDSDQPLRFEPVPFDHPLWILYSSGTTGTPKPIVHGHGGILLEHLKALSLHLDLVQLTNSSGLLPPAG
jgi:acetoacetyl-CoA synthetase